ncbi:hypothetical protein [Bradyrhizobium sp. ORS 285]
MDGPELSNVSLVEHGSLPGPDDLQTSAICTSRPAKRLRSLPTKRG